MKKIIEHYNKWLVVYGIAGAVILIAMATFANEAVRKFIITAWDLTPKHSFGWAAAGALGLLCGLSVLATAKMLYVVFYGKGVVAKVKWRLAAVEKPGKRTVPFPGFGEEKEKPDSELLPDKYRAK